MFFDIYKKLCEENGESPYNLPVNLGIMKKNSGVAQWKKGSVPRNDTLQVLADHFGVSIAYLMGLEQKETPRPLAEAEDPLDREIFERISRLSGEDKVKVLEKVIELELESRKTEA